MQEERIREIAREMGVIVDEVREIDDYPGVNDKGESVYGFAISPRKLDEDSVPGIELKAHLYDDVFIGRVPEIEDKEEQEKIIEIACFKLAGAMKERKE